jgi:hypothetical protein
MTNDYKVLENRLRRVAKRRGMTLTKSRSRDPKAIDYGRYSLAMIDGGQTIVVSDKLRGIDAFLK